MIVVSVVEIDNSLPDELQKSGPPYITTADGVHPVGSVVRCKSGTQAYRILRETTRAEFIRMRGIDNLDEDCLFFYEVEPVD